MCKLSIQQLMVIDTERNGAVNNTDKRVMARDVENLV